MGPLTKRDRLSAAERSWVAEKISYLTAGELPRPRIDWSHLDASEEHELKELLSKACEGQTKRQTPDVSRRVNASVALTSRIRSRFARPRSKRKG